MQATRIEDLMKFKRWRTLLVAANVTLRDANGRGAATTLIALVIARRIFHHTAFHGIDGEPGSVHHSTSSSLTVMKGWAALRAFELARF